MAPPCPELEGPSSFFPLWGPKEPAPLARSLNPTPSTAAVPAAVLFAETTLHPRSRERAAGAERELLERRDSPAPRRLSGCPAQTRGHGICGPDPRPGRVAAPSSDGLTSGKKRAYL